MLIGEDIVVSPRTLALITLMAVSVFSGNARASRRICSQPVMRTSAS